MANPMLAPFEDKMKKTIDQLDKEYGTIRAGRASPAVLDKVHIDYYGVPTPIQQVGTISVAEARILVIQPWDKSLLKAIEKAIQASDLGINPQNDGNVLRIEFPRPTEERRKELCKQVSKYGEEAKVAIRNVRRDAIDKAKAMKKSGELTEDDLAGAEKDVQTLTDRYCKLVDERVAAKEKEILEI